jgi:membrane protease YdiL (CAAX protease family)
MSKKTIKPKKNSQISEFKQPWNPYQIWALILIIWFVYRAKFQMPEWVDEFISKPLVFIAPIIFYVRKIEKRTLDSIGLTGANFFTSLYTGLGFGFIFALEGLFANYMKYGEIRFNPLPSLAHYGLLVLLVLSVATAISEELLCRGFLFTRIYEKKKSVFFAAIISAVLFLLLHVPILITTTKLTGMTLIIFIITDLLLGVANAFLFFNNRSLLAPILVHIFWNMTVAMYL